MEKFIKINWYNIVLIILWLIVGSMVMFYNNISRIEYGIVLFLYLVEITCKMINNYYIHTIDIGDD